MAEDSQNKAFHALRSAVGQTLEMAEAQSKISEETKLILAQLLLTRRGNGDFVIDMSNYYKSKSEDNQWVNRDRSEQERYLNPTRLPQVIPGLSGLASSQYLAFVQHPLEKDGSNGPMLEAQSERLFAHYNTKENTQERNRLFGHSQRYIAKLLIDNLLSHAHKTTDKEEINKLREQTPPAKQFEMAAKALNCDNSHIVDMLSHYAIAFTLIERIILKARHLEKSQPKLEWHLKQLAAMSLGPNAKNRIKDLFLGFNQDLQTMDKLIKELTLFFTPIIKRMHNDHFATSFSEFHTQAAILDAYASRWLLILGELTKNDPNLSIVDKIKGLHLIYAS